MKLILACDPDGGIGFNNSLPWKHLEGDLPRFKNLTQGQAIVMGRNTWDSLPIKPLPDRLNIVITSCRLLEVYTQPVITGYSLNLLNEFPDSWIIGGARLINSCWDKITEIHLSRTLAKYHCDTYIDLVELDNFKQVSIESFSDHTYEIWKKI